MRFSPCWQITCVSNSPNTEPFKWLSQTNQVAGTSEYLKKKKKKKDSNNSSINKNSKWIFSKLPDGLITWL